MSIIILEGNWDSGFAYDYHSLGSRRIEDNQLGRPQYETLRTPMGNHVYDLKYNNDRTRLPLIIGLLESAGRSETISNFDYIIPAPPTKRRAFQPVSEIARRVGDRFEVPVLDDYLLKGGNSRQIKNVHDQEEKLRLLRAAMSIQGTVSVADKEILLIDDIYDSGATLTVATELLRNQGGASRVCVMTMTRTGRPR